VRFLFVVHRYPPYPGGSEHFVQAMAEESARRGHAVVVLARLHAGDRNGIALTDRVEVIRELFDLVVVHGANPPLQATVLLNAASIRSPVLYVLVRPWKSAVARLGMRESDYLGWMTAADLAFIRDHGQEEKARRIRCGVDPRRVLAGRSSGFRRRHRITTRYLFHSAGGFWPNKGMRDLAEAFREAAPEDATLLLTGYTSFNEHTPQEGPGVRTLVLPDRDEVHAAMAEADIYVMNSTEEGFGLVLLEAMLLRTPWVARPVGGVPDLASCGTVCFGRGELVEHLRRPVRDAERVDRAFTTAWRSHTVARTVDDIEAVAAEGA
jgi:glycosyltransferase involved in cell wall biosynthesis